VKEARLFVELLRQESRAPVLYAELPGAQHAFEVFPSERTGHALAAVERFLAYQWATHRGAIAGAESAAIRHAARVQDEAESATSAA